MTQKDALTVAGVAGVALACIGSLAWGLLLPTIGLLWVVGWLH